MLVELVVRRMFPSLGELGDLHLSSCEDEEKDELKEKVSWTATILTTTSLLSES